jgi:hypothetical protein
VWKNFQSRFQRLLESLGRHRDLIQSQADLQHFQQYQVDRIKILEDLKGRGKQEQNEKFTTVLKWMSGASTSLDHQDACNARGEYPGTGKWILKNNKVRNWREAPIPTESSLWINGIPGAGKTILASVIIADCLEDKTIETAYFYCKHADTEKNTSMSIFRGLISQLLTQNRSLLPFCHDKTLAKGELTLTSTTTAQTLLELFFESSPKQYVIIDGLDECSAVEYKMFLSFFTTLLHKFDSKEPGKLRALFISQNEDGIKNALSTAASISLGPDDIENDLHIFTRKWSEKIGLKFDLAPEEVDHVARSTCDRAEGMFLFAKLVMMNLYQQPSRNKLRKEFHPTRFPKGLEQAYQRILNRIKENSSEEEWKIAHKILGWMVCATRPLKWYEVQAAVSTDVEEQTVDFDERMLRVHIRDLCGSLVQIAAGDRVGLVHHTARQ